MISIVHLLFYAMMYLTRIAELKLHFSFSVLIILMMYLTRAAGIETPCLPFIKILHFMMYLTPTAGIETCPYQI